MASLGNRWRGAPPLVRAEALATSWEVFSVLLFSSAVVPAAFATPWPSAAFLGSLVVSNLLGRRLAARGRRGYLAAAIVRVVSWPLVAVLFVDGFDLRTMVAVTGFALMAGIVRRALYRRELDPMPADPSPVRVRADLTTELAENAALAGVVGGHVMLLFGVAFLRTASAIVLRAWWEIIPGLAILGTIGFTLAVRPAVAPIVAALRQGPQGQRDLLVDGLAAAVRLPRRLSHVNFAIWILCTSIGILYFRPGPQAWSWADAVMQLMFGALFSWGISFYQRGWHEDSVAPIVRRLRTWSGSDADDERQEIDLLQRLLEDFGLPLLFTLTLSLLSAIGMYRTLAEEAPLRQDFNSITALNASFVMLLLAAGGAFLRAARRLASPLGRLAAAAERVAQGHLEAAVPRVAGPVEVVALGRSIERMRGALARTIADLEAERASLETNVELRTAELKATLEELKQAQTALIQGERLALIGELVAGVAHEIYNPLNAIHGSMSSLPRIEGEIRTMLEAYEDALGQLSEADQARLRALRDEVDLDGALDDLEGVAKVVRSATKRSVDIVGNLKSFARVPVEPLPSDLHAGLSDTLSLLRHRLRHRGIEIEERFEAIPLVTCRAGEINQVFMNLITNAIDAVHDAHGGSGGRIVLTTRRVDDAVEISVADDGAGVDATLQTRIFDPFFTTKLDNHGTGLGLSISSEIIRRHGGSLTLQLPSSDDEAPCANPISSRELGRGATFCIRLPITPDLPRSRPSKRELAPSRPARLQ